MLSKRCRQVDLSSYICKTSFEIYSQKTISMHTFFNTRKYLYWICCFQVESGSTSDPAVLKPCLAALGCLTPEFFSNLPLLNQVVPFLFWRVKCDFSNVHIDIDLRLIPRGNTNKYKIKAFYKSYCLWLVLPKCSLCLTTSMWLLSGASVWSSGRFESLHLFWHSCSCSHSSTKIEGATTPQLLSILWFSKLAWFLCLFQENSLHGNF